MDMWLDTQPAGRVRGPWPWLGRSPGGYPLPATPPTPKPQLGEATGAAPQLGWRHFLLVPLGPQGAWGSELHPGEDAGRS